MHPSLKDTPTVASVRGRSKFGKSQVQHFWQLSLSIPITVSFSLDTPWVLESLCFWLWDTTLPPLVRERVDIIVHRHDCVPRMCLGSLARLMASLRAVDQLGLTTSEAVSALALGNQQGKEVRAKVAAALEKVEQETFPYLQHPGTILYLEPEGEEGCLAVRQPSERFTKQLLVVDRMIADHRKESYQDAIQRFTRSVLHAV